MYYVYEWFIKNTGEIIYVGKGTRNRYKTRKHNKFFNDMINRYDCDSRIVQYFNSEQEAFDYEFLRIKELKEKNQCVCNIYNGGTGGTTSWWTPEKREWYSNYNCMKNENQRKRMSINNPMKNKDVRSKVTETYSKQIVINNTIYKNAHAVSKLYNKCLTSVYTWIKQGKTCNNEVIHYLGESPRTPTPKINKQNKNVYIDNLLFTKVKDAAFYLNVDPSTLIKCIKSNKLCKGHTCKYANQQPSYRNSEISTVEGSTTNE